MSGETGTGPMGQGQGRGFGRNSLGAGGKCVCTNCGEKVSHQRGIPCNTVNCPKCGMKMIRE